MKTANNTPAPADFVTPSLRNPLHIKGKTFKVDGIVIVKKGSRKIGSRGISLGLSVMCAKRDVTCYQIGEQFYPTFWFKKIATAKELLVADLKPGFHLYGNKGALWSNEAHIMRSTGGSTLCGTPMLATNWCEIEKVEVIGCKKCKAEYAKLTK